MSLTYNPTNWINKKTPLNSNNMNNIESGIVQAINSINSIISQLNEIENLINSEFITSENIKDNAVTYNKTNFVIKDGNYLKIPELTINGEQISVVYEGEQTDLQTYLNELVIRLTYAINSLRTEIYNQMDAKEATIYEQMDEKLHAIWTTLEQADAEIHQAFADVDSRFTSTENDYNGKFSQVQDALIALNAAVTALQEAVSGALKRQVVQELPITGEPNIIYMVPAEPEFKKVPDTDFKKEGDSPLTYTWNYKADLEYYTNIITNYNIFSPSTGNSALMNSRASGYKDFFEIYFTSMSTYGEITIDQDTTAQLIMSSSSPMELYTLVKGNIYNEYLWIDNQWEKIGDTKTDLTDYYTKAEVDEKINDKFNEGLVIARHNDVTAYNAQNNNLVTVYWENLYVSINPTNLVNKDAYFRLTLTLADTENEVFTGDMTFKLKTADNSEYSYVIRTDSNIKSPGSYAIDIPLEDFVLNDNNILSQTSNIKAFMYFTYGITSGSVSADRYSVTLSDIRFTKSPN